MADVYAWVVCPCVQVELENKALVQIGDTSLSTESREEMLTLAYKVGSYRQQTTVSRTHY
jgi:hypothetical protein